MLNTSRAVLESKAVMEAEKPQPEVIHHHISLPQHDQSVATLQFSVERNRWMNEHQPKETRVGFLDTKVQQNTC